jgi:hypothetical protein
MMAVVCERRDGDARGRDGSSVVCAKVDYDESEMIYLGEEQGPALERRRNHERTDEQRMTMRNATVRWSR